MVRGMVGKGMIENDSGGAGKIKKQGRRSRDEVRGWWGTE